MRKSGFQLHVQKMGIGSVLLQEKEQQPLILPWYSNQIHLELESG